MRRFLGLAALLFATLTSACGGSTHPVFDAATVAGQSVSRAEVVAYVRYADSFYRTAGASGSPIDCSHVATSSPCLALRRQALARLIEESIVVAYAHQHGISIGATDRASITSELQTLRSSDPTTQRLLRSHAVTARFLVRLLTTEALVRKVEQAVAYAGASRGYSYHVHLYALPVDAAGSAARTYRQAERLATDGKPVPPGTTEHRRWVATFRLPGPLARSLQAASNGDFVGPFRQDARYLVARRLGAGIHAYGTPARLELETRLFKRWLAAQMRVESPRCFDLSGKSTGCPTVG